MLGHFAFFAEEVIKQNYTAAITFFYFTIFLSGALHQILAEWIAIKRPNLSHVIPISLEITILLLVGFFGVQRFINIIKEMDCLFNALSMGVQNSMVTQISNSIVRTTH
jgi:uncharacterized membrane protein YoaK (UPF0700 family)